MPRDVQRQCAEANCVSLIKNVDMPIDEMVNKIAAHFGLEI